MEGRRGWEAFPRESFFNIPSNFLSPNPLWKGFEGKICHHAEVMTESNSAYLALDISYMEWVVLVAASS